MKATIKIKEELFTVDLSDPIDISIPMKASNENPSAWYLKPPAIKPVQLEEWIGSVEAGAAVNFNNIWFNPHAHGTHTECLGHITKDFHSINDAITNFFFTAELISVAPEDHGVDRIISLDQIKDLLNGTNPQAVIIRTLPNTEDKLSKDYSHTNWPYISEAAAVYLRELGVEHLLIDLPSVDKEKDDGQLLAHRAFWNHPDNPKRGSTITEFIYVDNKVVDGTYLLNLQVAPFHNDAAPSRPVLYQFI
ncbi:MAG: cyclase family protein [Flavobacteriaceae bacterium]|nr:cyclase family protein [Flavobacteriaceae bacterium]